MRWAAAIDGRIDLTVRDVSNASEPSSGTGSTGETAYSGGAAPSRRIVAVPDTLDRARQAVQRWAISQMLGNDVLPEGSTRFRLMDGRTETGGSVTVEGDQLVYRPAPDLPEDVVDTFSYEIRNGSDVSRATVRLLCGSWTPANRQTSAQWLPKGRGLQLRFNAAPDRRFRVLSSSSAALPGPWEDSGRADSDSVGRLMWTDPAPVETGRFYRIEQIP